MARWSRASTASLGSVDDQGFWGRASRYLRGASTSGVVQGLLSGVGIVFTWARSGGPPQRAPIPDSGSFPSGHTLHATLSAVVVALFVPPLAPVFVLVALLVGASRVTLGVHYPSDVAAGAALGGLLGAVVGLLV